MKQSINVYQFRDAFRDMGRNDNFSYDGLGVLFEYFEDLGEDIGEEIELDVIALCCEYSEMTYDEIVNDYIASGKHIYDRDAKDELTIIEDEININHYDDVDREQYIKDEQNEYLLEWLQERTTVLPVDDDTVIIQAF